MNKKNNGGCCSGTKGCCETVEEVKPNINQLVIDFLYLDLSVCTRCQGAENNLDEAREHLAQLEELDIDLDEVTGELLDEGLEKFSKPYDKLIETIAVKQAEYITA